MSRSRAPHPLSFPLRVDHRGRTAEDDLDGHVRGLIEQLLFTSPGERVNRPDFGTQLRQVVFAPNSEELASALEHTIRGALQRYLSEHISVEAIDIAADEARLCVELSYRVQRSAELRQARFEREL